MFEVSDISNDVFLHIYRQWRVEIFFLKEGRDQLLTTDRRGPVLLKLYFFDKNLIFYSNNTQLLLLTSFGMESTCPPVSLLLQLVGQIPEKPQSQGSRTPCKNPHFLTKAGCGCKLLSVKTKRTPFFKSVGCCASFGMITTPIAHLLELHYLIKCWAAVRLLNVFGRREVQF